MLGRTIISEKSYESAHTHTSKTVLVPYPRAAIFIQKRRIGIACPSSYSKTSLKRTRNKLLTTSFGLIYKSIGDFFQRYGKVRTPRAIRVLLSWRFHPCRSVADTVIHCVVSRSDHPRSPSPFHNVSVEVLVGTHDNWFGFRRPWTHFPTSNGRQQRAS